MTVTTPTAKAIRFSIGFSGHAHDNPSRYVPKAPPEPEFVSSISAASFRSITVAAGCDSLLAPLESAARILPGDRLLTRTPRIFGIKDEDAHRLRYKVYYRKEVREASSVA